jgi:hypothetical protein
MINEQRIWRHIGVLCLFLAGASLFAFTKNIFAWAVIPVFVALAMLIGKPRALLWCGLSWFMVSLYFQYELHLPLVFNYLDELITLGMLGVLFVNARGNDSVWTGRQNLLQPLPKIAFVFMVLSLGSAVLNHAVDYFFIMWCFQYFRMFVILFFVACFFRKADLKVFVRFIMTASVIQFLLNVSWVLHINPLPNRKEYWPNDFGIGTLNGCDIVAYFCIMAIILCLAVMLDPPSRKVRWQARGVLVVTFINFMLTNTNHAYFILGAALVTFFIFNKAEIRKVISLPVLSGLGVLVAISLFVFSFTNAGQELRPEYVRQRYKQFMQGTKIDSYRRNFTELPHESSVFWLAGLGPCQGGSAIGAGLRRPIADKYFNVLYNEEQYRKDIVSGSIATGPKTGILTLWSELGPPGAFLIALTYFVAFFKCWRVVGRQLFIDKYHSAISRSSLAIFVVVLLVAFLRDLFFLAWFAGVVWIWVALTILPRKCDADQVGVKVVA